MGFGNSKQKSKEVSENLLKKNKKSDSYAAIDASYSTIAATLLGLVIIATVSGFMLYRGAISVPVVAMTQTMSSLAAGEMQVEVPGVGRKDEIGAMASAVAVFKQNAIERKHLEDEARAKEAQSAEEKNGAPCKNWRISSEATVGGGSCASCHPRRPSLRPRPARSPQRRKRPMCSLLPSPPLQSRLRRMSRPLPQRQKQLAASAQEIGGQVAQTCNEIRQCRRAGPRDERAGDGAHGISAKRLVR